MRIVNRQTSKKTATIAALIVCTIYLFSCEDNMGFLDNFIGPREGTAEYHYQRGLDSFYKPVFNEAIKEFSLAINENSAFVDAYLSRGMAYTFLREYDRAINDFDQSLRLDPQNVYAGFWKLTASNEMRHEEITLQEIFPDETSNAVDNESADEIKEKLSAFIHKANDYRSNLVFKDLQSNEFKENEYTYMRWYFNYEKPDSFSVTQTSSIEDIDKWVSLGNQHTRMAWFYTINLERSQKQADLESFLHIGKYVELLSHIEQDNIYLQLVNNGAFYFLQAKLPGGIKLGNWSIPEFRRKLADSLLHLMGTAKEDGTTLDWYLVPTVTETDPPRSIGINKNLSIVETSISGIMKLWIRTDDYALYRAEISMKGELENNKPISYKIEQVVSDYNSGVRVVIPPN